jgi:hypothetical protein
LRNSTPDKAKYNQSLELTDEGRGISDNDYLNQGLYRRSSVQTLDNDEKH